MSGLRSWRDGGFPDDGDVFADMPGFDENDSDLDDEEEGWEDCGMGPDGQCSNAGTEWCDWHCGFRRYWEFL